MDDSGSSWMMGHAHGANDSSQLETDAAMKAVAEQFGEPHPPVAIVVASRDEYMLAESAAKELTSRGIGHQIHELSPTRSPEILDRFLDTAGMRGIRVFIATAGLVAWLPSMIATRTDLPVIGVPIANSPISGLGGLDTLLATAQAPPGMPVACMGVGSIRNAAIFAARMLGVMPSDDSSSVE